MSENMVLTCTEGRNALTHVLTNVFDIGTDHPLALALENHGYHDINDIMGMSFEDIKALTYEDDQGQEMDLPRVHQFPINILQRYQDCCSAWGRPICGDWESITAQDFNDFAELLGFNPAKFPWKGQESLLTPLSVTLTSISHAIAPKLTVHAIILAETLKPSHIIMRLEASTATPLSVMASSHAITLEPTPESMPMLFPPDDKEFDVYSGEGVLVDPGTTPGSSLTLLHRYQELSSTYPVPLATLQGHYNTVPLLPPANGPPSSPTQYARMPSPWSLTLKA